MFNLWRHRLQSLPLDPPPDPGGRVVVLSAHPDDEVLAVGGWIATQADRDLVFVTATDAAGSHLADAPGATEGQHSGLVDALHALGVADPVVHRLGLPEGGLARHRDRLAELLEPVLRDADLVLAPFEADGHPDHDALGAVAVALCGDRVVLWRYPIWTWALTCPDDQPWLAEARRLDCRSTARGRKRRAVGAFRPRAHGATTDPRATAVAVATLLDHALLAPEVVLATADRGPGPRLDPAARGTATA